MSGGDLTGWVPGPVASVMTRGLFNTEPTMAYCGDCKGKGFNLSKGPRASRKCPRCRGTGSFRVGSTKR